MAIFGSGVDPESRLRGDVVERPVERDGRDAKRPRGAPAVTMSPVGLSRAIRPSVRAPVPVDGRAGEAPGGTPGPWGGEAVGPAGGRRGTARGTARLIASTSGPGQRAAGLQVVDLGLQEFVGDGQLTELGPEPLDLQIPIVALARDDQGGLATGQEIVPPAGRR
jgi:hypothetical protein